MTKILMILKILIVSGFSVSAQTSNQQNNREEAEVARDTIPSFKPDRFIRLGFDVSALARQIVEPEVQQFEFSLDSEVAFNWFAVADGGFMRVNGDREDFRYSASGFFGRLGFDYNLLKRIHPAQNDLVLVGMRYGFSALSHEAPFYDITNPYWGDYTGQLEKGNYSLHWIEFSGGVKTEVFSNVFLGWYLKTRIRLTETKEPELNPYYIGGYGRGVRTAPIMVHFSIMYRFGL
ncbi:MAG: hypothetical protein EA361_11455 [Bacteroidetes bacterium]|nr:MAG: hypothetical protein EA361_11455 [Bacteroidota bacterium]